MKDLIEMLDRAHKLDALKPRKHSSVLKEDVQLPSNVHAYDIGRISSNGIEYLDFLGKDGPEYEFTLEDYYYQSTNLGKRLVMIIKIDDGDEYLVVMDDGRVMDILYQGSEKWATYIIDTMKECLNDLHNVDGFISAISNSDSAVRELEQQIALNEVNDIAEYMIDGIQRYPDEWREDNDPDSVVASIIDELKDKKYGYFKDYDFDLTSETLNTVAKKVLDLIMPTIQAL